MMRVLVTGSSGVVGQALIRASAAEKVEIVAASRAPEGGEEPAARISIDLTAPALGLEPTQARALLASVDAVVHSAGLTEWGLAPECYEAPNVLGTRHLLEIASDAGTPVHFVSTAFVAAALPAHRVRPLPATNITAAYIHSKLRAEALVAASDVGGLVVRPPNLIGHHLDGWTSKPQIVQLLANWLMRGRAETLYVTPGNLMDMFPQDVLATIILRLLREGADGGEIWATLGDRALTTDQVLDILTAERRAQGKTLDRPALLPAPWPPREIDTTPDARYRAVLRDVDEVTAISGGCLPSGLAGLNDSLALPAIDPAHAFAATIARARRRSRHV